MNMIKKISLILVALSVTVAGVSTNVAFSAEQKASAKKVVKKSKKSSANRFNRLFKGPANFNLSQMKDGFHDPENAGTEMLQPPKEAFADLPKSRAGNRVDWVKALNEGYIEPRADLTDDSKKMTVLNLDIVREVKGSMPDVVYPHKPHTQWLQCSNCHPKIFKPKKGANKISMAAILAGQYCGVCHGKVAFPISECRNCHSKKKTKKQVEERSKYRNSPLDKTAKTSAGGAAAKPLRQMNRGELIKLGAKVYEDTCAGCHGEQGEGVPETFPALKGSKIATGSVDKHINIVLNGKDDTAMQPWREDLTIEELAAVISYERVTWGNTGGIVQPIDIKKMLDASAPAADAEEDGEETPRESLADMSKAQLMKKGAGVYEENCSGCHGGDGEGVADMFPPLKDTKVANGPLAEHLKVVLHGKEDTAMQAWKDELGADSIAAVITFERNSWGNKGGDLIQPSAVAKARK
ncbi:MAG: c-type cytochrome [Magnetovibrio sp.]|nr:c-type cytochrome [Magnetovibrio sp.]